MKGRPDIGGPVATAIFGAVCGFIIALLFVRVGSGNFTPFARKPRDGGTGAAFVPASALPAVPPPAAPPPTATAAKATTAATAVASAAKPAPLAAKRSYNVLLITVDTLRADLGFAGYPKPITPNLDALAARSVVFERAYATASFTPKSLGPMQIGRYASETHRDFEHYTTFFPSNIFLAERAHDAGVRTFAGMCHRYFTFNAGLQQGFDVWDTSAMPPGMTDNDRRFSSDRLTEVALRLLAKPQNTGGPQRFFAWFHYFDPHAPYVPHAGAPDFAAGERTRSGRARAEYDEEVWFTDGQIGRLLGYVASQPWAADTVIVLTADHGEAFGEHNHWMHGRELWEPLVRVPLVMFVPGAKPKRVATKRSHIDLAPTILDLLGAPVPSDGFLRGTSLVSDVSADPALLLPERDVYMDMPVGPFNEERHALITGTSPGMKVIDVAGRHFEVYDLARDPEEHQNLASDAAVLGPLVAKLRGLRSTLQEIPPGK